MTLSSVFLLTAASVVGGVLQLPVVGGGSQLATIGMLRGVFNLSPELATSCGIMLWLVTFMSVIPAGLVLAHFEHVSLTQIEEESLEEEQRRWREPEIGIAGDWDIGPSVIGTSEKQLTMMTRIARIAGSNKFLTFVSASLSLCISVAILDPRSSAVWFRSSDHPMSRSPMSRSPDPIALPVTIELTHPH